MTTALLDVQGALVRVLRENTAVRALVTKEGVYSDSAPSGTTPRRYVTIGTASEAGMRTFSRGGNFGSIQLDVWHDDRLTVVQLYTAVEMALEEAFVSDRWALGSNALATYDMNIVAVLRDPENVSHLVARLDYTTQARA